LTDSVVVLGGMHLMFLSPEASLKPECEMELHVLVLVGSCATYTISHERVGVPRMMTITVTTTDRLGSNGVRVVGCMAL
jgi:hypothetical protein